MLTLRQDKQDRIDEQRRVWKILKQKMGKRKLKKLSKLFRNKFFIPRISVQYSQVYGVCADELQVSTGTELAALFSNFLSSAVSTHNARTLPGNYRLGVFRQVISKLYAFKVSKVKRHFLQFGLLGMSSGETSWCMTFQASTPTCICPPEIHTTTKHGKFRNPRYPGRYLDTSHTVTLPPNWHSTIKDCPNVGNKILLCRYPTKYPDIWSASWVTKGRAIADVKVYYGLMRKVKTGWKFATTFKELGVADDE